MRSPARNRTLALVIALGFVLLMAACAPSATITPVFAIVNPTVIDYPVEAGVDATFEAVLRVATAINLSVDSLDRQAGLMRFLPATLSARQLDTFCFYPLIHPATGAEWDTFANWNARSAQPVSGTVTYTALVTRASKGSNLTLRSAWVGGTETETYACNSRRVSEDDFAAQVKALVE